MASSKDPLWFAHQLPPCESVPRELMPKTRVSEAAKGAERNNHRRQKL